MSDGYKDNLLNQGQELQQVIEFAVHAHAGQYRKRSLSPIPMPYVVHSLDVLKTLWSWGVFYVDILKASVGHDLKEETTLTWEEIEKIFGQRATLFIRELTCEKTNKEDKAEYLASFHKTSLEALLVKVADRCCNTLDFYLTDPHYARIYFHKADEVFAALHAREKELLLMMGENVMERVLMTVSEVERKVDVIENA